MHFHSRKRLERLSALLAEEMVCVRVCKEMLLKPRTAHKAFLAVVTFITHYTRMETHMNVKASGRGQNFPADGTVTTEFRCRGRGRGGGRSGIERQVLFGEASCTEEIQVV